MKYCPKCKIKKENIEFYKDLRTPDKLYGICKKCHLCLSNTASRKKRKEKSKKKWKEEQPICYICNNVIPNKRFYISGDKAKYCSKKCMSQRGKIHYQKNKKEINIKSKPKKKEYYEKVIKPNKKIYEIQCKFCDAMIKTTSTTRKYCNRRCNVNFYRKKKYKTDPLYKIEVNLRSRIRQALKKTKKSKSTMELVGCSLPELKKYIENLFKPGMSWENYCYYGWHIDHIMPCSSFDLSIPEEQKKCFHYINLQPLWAKENMQKSNKVVK